jgi:hypothetical protein
MTISDDDPIAYDAVAPGTPVATRDGHSIGTVEHVLTIPSEDIFDGIVVNTDAGVRFVDRDQIVTITRRAITTDLSTEEAASLPEPDGSPVYHADALADTGDSLNDWFGKLFRRGKWKPEQD